MRGKCILLCCFVTILLTHTQIEIALILTPLEVPRNHQMRNRSPSTQKSPSPLTVTSVLLAEQVTHAAYPKLSTGIAGLYIFVRRRGIKGPITCRDKKNTIYYLSNENGFLLLNFYFSRENSLYN